MGNLHSEVWVKQSSLWLFYFHLEHFKYSVWKIYVHIVFSSHWKNMF